MALAIAERPRGSALRPRNLSVPPYRPIQRRGYTACVRQTYLLEGRRVTEWITPGVVKYHRTVASHVNSLLAHGFQLVRLEEWGPNQEQIAAHPEWADEAHCPPFLLLAARHNSRCPDEGEVSR
jgi:hypothetical protein